MAFKPLGGTSRKYVNTETGEILSRRKYDESRGIFYEKKADANRTADPLAAIARPAKGRKKAASVAEAEIRLEAEKVSKAAEEEARNKKKLLRAAASHAKKVKHYVIRKQMLPVGHRGVRVGFVTWEEFEDYRRQMNGVLLPNGRRLISSYAIGIYGYDEREERDGKPRKGEELSANLIKLQSPRVNLTEEELRELTDDFLMEHPYFVFSHYYIHFHFDKQFAEERAKKAKEKNIPKQYRKKG